MIKLNPRVTTGLAVLLPLLALAELPAPEFTVLWSDTNPQLKRNPSHPDYVTAPRVALRWNGKTQPFAVGHRKNVRGTRDSQPEFDFATEIHDTAITFTLTPKRNACFSVAFTGAPATPIADTLPVPQECDARGHKQFNFVLCEADLKLPRVHVASKAGNNNALVADPRECRFRLPTLADSRFGLMLQHENGKLKPVLFAPLLGGAESQMKAGQPYRFTLRYVERPGDWKETYRYIARDIHGFRDQRDNSGPGPLNLALERSLAFLAGPHALWDSQQKYYDYWCDKTGVFKPFSPLFGLSAAIVTDDEEFFRQRARPAVEFALSRKYNVFAPYDNADNKQARSAQRDLGAPYISREQLLSLDDFFQHRSPVLKTLAQQTEPARTAGAEAALFDALERNDLPAAVDAAYRLVTTLNMFPAVPDTNVTVDAGGLGPVHPHSFGRHRNTWGFPPPQPVPVPEQTVPAWRVARLGLPSPAYPMEYWMNTHAALLRVAALANDDFLRDVARWGMVGRFGNYPGDNRSKVSLVAELPDAIEHPPWDWNFATVNPGHAWEFAGAVLDFLVTDAFDRSHGAIDFPASSLAGSNFRVRTYGAKPGRFAGEDNVHLWLPRGLLTCDNRQFNWLTGYGNGKFYLALLNQSFREEHATVTLNRDLVECVSNRIAVTVAPKGIATFALPATVKPRLQAKLYAEMPALGSGSYTNIGPVHAMLLRAGRGLTSAYVYTEALPEDVIVAKLHWRQGDGTWQELTDEIYPYEFSIEIGEGDFQCFLEIENARQQLQRSGLITLKP